MNNIFEAEKKLTEEEFNAMTILERYRWFLNNGEATWSKPDQASIMRIYRSHARIMKKKIDDRDFRE